MCFPLPKLSLQEFEPQEPPQLGGDFFIGAAYAYPFVTTENPVLGGGATGGGPLAGGAARLRFCFD